MSTEATDRLREWATEVERAYADGGYAAGDGPPAPLDEVLAVLDENERQRAALGFVEEFIAVGGNGEGWTLDDMFDAARWALGHELEPRVLHKLRLILGDPLPGEEQT